MAIPKVKIPGHAQLGSVPRGPIHTGLGSAKSFSKGGRVTKRGEQTSYGRSNESVPNPARSKV